MAAWSSLEIKNTATVIGSQTEYVKSETNDVRSMMENMAQEIAQGHDDSSYKLASDWRGLADQFWNAGETIKKLGEQMEKALKKYSEQTVENETKSSVDLGKASDDIESLGQYFQS